MTMSFLLAVCSLFLIVDAWHVDMDAFRVSVNETSFAYTITGPNSTEWLSQGGVAFQCGGKRWTALSAKGSDTSSTLIPGVILISREIVDPNLGPYSAIQRGWEAPSCGKFTTEIRKYKTGAMGVEFVTEVLGPALQTGRNCSFSQASECLETATEFPSFELPVHTAPIGFQTWTGNSLRGESSRPGMF